MNRHLRLTGCFVVSRDVFAALLQAVSSRRGPIYRARIYVNTHVMGTGNAYLIMWKYAYLVMEICIFGYVRIRAQ